MQPQTHFTLHKNMIAQIAPVPAPVSLLLYSNLCPSPSSSSSSSSPSPSPSSSPSLLRHRSFTPSPRLTLIHRHTSNPKTYRATINQSVTAEEEEEEEEEEGEGEGEGEGGRDHEEGGRGYEGGRGGYVEGEGEDFSSSSSAAAAETTLHIERNGKNSRRISVTIPISAPLDTLWRALTDYERLSEFIPGLAVCEVQERWHDGARLYQIGEQNLAFGLKFKAKGVIVVTEKQLESIPCGIRRSIEFEMVEGDFKIFKGAWQMEEVTSTTDNDITKTLLTYVVDVQPKAWLPVRLVEGRLSNEIQNNLVCVRNEAQRLEWTSSPSGRDPTCHE